MYDPGSSPNGLIGAPKNKVKRKIPLPDKERSNRYRLSVSDVDKNRRSIAEDPKILTEQAAMKIRKIAEEIDAQQSVSDRFKSKLKDMMIDTVQKN